MSLDAAGVVRSASPASSGRSSPVPRSRRAVEDGLYKADKSLRRYAALIERALSTWETSPQEWADYIAFLGRLLKVLTAYNESKEAPFLPHTAAVTSKLAQCLNPALPSGVHQKAIEVYAYIFSTFSHEYLSAHLHEYLPGLASVFSFASLSVRPALYPLFEDHILALPSLDLRPALKSLLLALLPAIEEETSEDFDRAFGNVDLLERKFTHYGSDGYFWQCLFLCVITSPSRRQGALNYMVRKLPRFATKSHDDSADVSDEISAEAEAATSPEPGLLVRCFVAGLSDAQMLVQRGFLDLLVSHLPIHSPILQSKADKLDLERLVSAALLVLLRRDMSLNKRLWTWLLGPEPKNENVTDHPAAAGSEASPQVEYFRAFSWTSLKNSVSAMFETDVQRPADLARPFRICLSLMDRWEISQTLVPEFFMPSLHCLYAYSAQASSAYVSEVLRSANLFFDGVEAYLMWASFFKLLQGTGDSSSDALSRLNLFEWVLEHFSVKDEEMLTTHIPLCTFYLLDVTVGSQSSVQSEAVRQAALRISARLLSLLPSRVFKLPDLANDGQSSPADGQMRAAIEEHYRTPHSTNSKARAPFRSPDVGRGLLARIAQLTSAFLREQDVVCLDMSTHLLSSALSKVQTRSLTEIQQLVDTIDGELLFADKQQSSLPFPAITCIVSVCACLVGRSLITVQDVQNLEPRLTAQILLFVSPLRSKYHVEATRLIWQLDDLLAPSDAIKVSLMGNLRSANTSRDNMGNASGHDSAIKRFAIVWAHSVPSGPHGATSRRGSATPTASDLTRLVRRLDVLSEPLLLVLDTLVGAVPSEADFVKHWLSGMAGLDRVFTVLLRRIEGLMLVFKRGPKLRDERQCLRETKYLLDILRGVLCTGGDWPWNCLLMLEMESHPAEGESGAMFVANCTSDILSHRTSHSLDVENSALRLLDSFLNSPIRHELGDIGLEDCLIERLLVAVEQQQDTLHVHLLQLIPTAIKLRLDIQKSDIVDDRNVRSPSGTKQHSTVRPKPESSQTNLAPSLLPPPLLLKCVRVGLTSKAAHFHYDQWLEFLNRILPTFADSIFASLLPLVESLCGAIGQAFQSLRDMTMDEPSGQGAAPDVIILGLLEALEMILARAHDSLVADTTQEASIRHQQQANGPWGAVAPSLFKVEGHQSKTAQSNSRLTVVLAFQDAIRTCLNIWTWSNHPSETDGFDMVSAATTSYMAIRLRNKTRHLLEQMFLVEPLESLEVVIARWRFGQQTGEASAALSLLQVMHGSRPKNTVPAILDALCSRANPAALPPDRLSSQSTNLSATDVALFLLAYLRSTEDDAMDELWADSISFLRDVLGNPLPYRLVLSPLVRLVHMLAQKTGNTNFGEQKKMKRELGDIFQRLLAATFATLSTSTIVESSSSNPSEASQEPLRADHASNFVTVLKDAIHDGETILETNERINTAVATISSSLIAPVFKAKGFPGNVTTTVLDLLQQMQKKSPTVKVWKKEVSDAFHDPKILASSAIAMEEGWFPVLHQWGLREKDRMPDLLARLAPPSSAGIMFGVGANAARLEADRRTQLNLRRICLLLLASPEDTWASHLRDFDEKLVELSAATNTSSPSSAIKADLYMLCRALVLALSSTQLAPLWPTINDVLLAALTSLLPGSASEQNFSNLGLLQAFKLLDQLTVLSPDEFQLHQWLYISDTVDAVYGPEGMTATALAEQVAETLGPAALDDIHTARAVNEAPEGTRTRRHLLSGPASLPDADDLKAMSRQEFSGSVMRPLLSQLSIHSYEGVYSMETAEIEGCRSTLLNDLLDVRSVVD
ncbi:hypothetical protein KC340_g16151 [Hortaea werneckii]|nr:hypothetical protein KC342_g16444 [Hortaea werneckii]KAI7211933.1 hypothetical protein KC365_g14795 [Hortaea werneckii]KAI7294446.1 hypothetical protein KC340_g16151 [Hortaea werneckii]